MQDFVYSLAPVEAAKAINLHDLSYGKKHKE